MRYQNTAGQMGNLEVDLNFMYRVPMWPVTVSDSFSVGSWQATEIPIVDIHELAAGKLAALMARRQSRDLFDCHAILQMKKIDPVKLRLAFIIYGAMNRKDWRTVSVTDVDFNADELSRQLIPTLRVGVNQRQENPSEYGSRLILECRKALSVVLPFTENENEFLGRLLEYGVIDASLLTSEAILQEKIHAQPLLQWKAINVRKHKGL